LSGYRKATRGVEPVNGLRPEWKEWRPDCNQVQPAMEKVTGSSPDKAATTRVLNWEVFVTPGIPIVTPDKPPGVLETYFQAMAAMLIYGVRDAVLVDAYMTVKQAAALADW
jgi:hypothetical protein